MPVLIMAIIYQLPPWVTNDFYDASFLWNLTEKRNYYILLHSYLSVLLISSFVSNNGLGYPILLYLLAFLYNRIPMDGMENSENICALKLLVLSICLVLTIVKLIVMDWRHDNMVRDDRKRLMQRTQTILKKRNESHLSDKHVHFSPKVHVFNEASSTSQPQVHPHDNDAEHWSGTNSNAMNNSGGNNGSFINSIGKNTGNNGSFINPTDPKGMLSQTLFSTKKLNNYIQYEEGSDIGSIKLAQPSFQFSPDSLKGIQLPTSLAETKQTMPAFRKRRDSTVTKEIIPRFVETLRLEDNEMDHSRKNSLLSNEEIFDSLFVSDKEKKMETSTCLKNTSKYNYNDHNNNSHKVGKEEQEDIETSTFSKLSAKPISYGFFFILKSILPACVFFLLSYLFVVGSTYFDEV